MSLTIFKALTEAKKKLEYAEIKNSHHEARLLLKYALNLSLEEIITASDRELAPYQLEKYESWVLRRTLHEPLSKIREEKEFWSLPFIVKADALDPRPDSETLIEAVFKTYPVREKRLNILDLGVGTGCLIITLLKEYLYSYGIGIDKSILALEVARLNLEKFKLHERLKLINTFWGEGIVEEFDIIVSNPPYIAETDRQMLSQEVIKYDPHIALFGGSDGLDAYRSLAPHAFRLLKSLGHLFLEIGKNQESSVQEILLENGFTLKEWIPDLAGILRCGIFQKAN
ncbi:MAG: protein-(glutamine-N5) methyltransferase, release factor-specific [Caedibacter sp. 37-49]|nr:MAG: protein-(glutamine-N5) methyltransferase, release factor-specific [Caedibacter sp. 37-49]